MLTAARPLRFCCYGLGYHEGAALPPRHSEVMAALRWRQWLGPAML